MDPGSRAEVVGALLRQLAIGLSTYRLYPGDLTQPALHTAVERIGTAFGPAAAEGTVDVTVHTGRFHADGRELDDDRLDRLAQACFSRRVEYVLVERPPTLDELAAFYYVLSADPEDVEEAEGVGAMLDARGVGSIVASAGAPSPTAADDEGETATTDDTPTVVGSDSALPQLTLLPTDTAATLYDRARAASDTLDDDASGRSTFFRTAAELVAELDPPQQDIFSGLVLDRIDTHAFADRYAGHLTDPQIADLIAAAAAGHGAEPVELAMEFVERTGRQQALVTLVQSVVADAQHATMPDEDRPAQPSDRLRDDFPVDAEDGRRLGLAALRDYLHAEDRPERLEPVAAVITNQLRSDVGDVAADRVSDLLAVLDDARSQRSRDVRSVLVAPRRRALSPAIVTTLATATATAPAAGADVLRQFGDGAVDAVVSLLGALGPNRTQAGTRLLALLAELVRNTPADLERHIDAHSWQVARDLATVLRMVGGTTTAPLLERLAHRDHPDVRREAMVALTRLPATAAAHALTRVIPTLPVRAEQRDGLELLSVMSAPETPELLRELGTHRGPDRLPLLLRWQARRSAARWAPQ